jgi:hypothetical protein|tara:strand:- start:60 stop:410 length:351 start_codon:yes stop_codon:yes gene_type:complete
MKKIIDIWFDAESYTVKVTSYQYIITAFKYIEAIFQIILCAIIFTFLLVLELTLLVIVKISALKLYKPKLKQIKPTQPPLTSVVSEKYNKHGMPETISKKSGPMSEKEYSDLRKVL